MKKNEIQNSADLFFYKSNSDLNSAKFLLKAIESSEVDIDLETVMFHLQQSAEKLLKSILSHNRIKFLKTHDIEELINMCIEKKINLVQNVQYLINLTAYAVEGRYAIIHDDLNDIYTNINILNTLYTKVQESINSEKI